MPRATAHRLYYNRMISKERGSHVYKSPYLVVTDKLDYWDVRLHNWALYYFGGGSLQGSSSICLLAATVPCWNDESRESALIGDAIDTANLVHKLDVLQQKALKAWYWSSGTKDFIAASLGVHRETLRNRVSKAKERLGDLQFQARRDLLKRETWAFGTIRL